MAKERQQQRIWHSHSQYPTHRAKNARRMGHPRVVAQIAKKKGKGNSNSRFPDGNDEKQGGSKRKADSLWE